jgi:hydroxymethylbilane synthase
MLEEASGSRVTLVKILSGGDVDLITPLHEMAGEGVFAKELQAALLAGEVDVVVHSLKDLPLQMPESAPVVAIPPRESPADLLVLLEDGDGKIPPDGARIGTSSPRRQSQLLALDRDIVPVDLRGNVDTRLRKLREGWVDGLILAEAARDRLPGDLFEALVTHRLPLDTYPTAPGQGAIALQTLARGEAASIARRVDDDETRRAVEAERTLLAELGGGCGMPLGMTVRRDGDMWIADASLASAAWREEGPPRLSRAHLVTGSLADVVPHVLGALRQSPAAASEVPAGAGHRRVLLVADAETSAAYRPRLEAVDFTVES